MIDNRQSDMAHFLDMVKQKGQANTRSDPEDEPGVTKKVPEEKLREFDLVSAGNVSSLSKALKRNFCAGAGNDAEQVLP